MKSGRLKGGRLKGTLPFLALGPPIFAIVRPLADASATGASHVQTLRAAPEIVRYPHACGKIQRRPGDHFRPPGAASISFELGAQPGQAFRARQ